MNYVLLIHAAEARYAAMSPEATDNLMQAYGSYSHELFATGKAGDCAALEPTATATCVQVRDGKRIVKDGPFAETREQLGGYYVFDAATQDEALAWAARIPDATDGTIEVRPVMATGTPAPNNDASKRDPKATKEYLLLIYESEQNWAAISDAEKGAIFGRYRDLGANLQAAGQFLGGAPLDPVRTAKSVSVVGGKRVVKDGPFAETREQLGGYYRVSARDLDEAIAIATKIPAVETGTIEIRPVMDTSKYA